MKTSFFILTGLVLFSLLSVIFISNYTTSTGAVPFALRATKGSDIGCAYPNCWQGIGLGRPPDLVVLNDWMAVNACFYTPVSEGGFASPMFEKQVGVLQHKFISKMRPPLDVEQYYDRKRSINFYIRQDYVMPAYLEKLPKPVVCNILLTKPSLWGTQIEEYKQRVISQAEQNKPRTMSDERV
jgi:hypothetical protein